MLSRRCWRALLTSSVLLAFLTGREALLSADLEFIRGDCDEDGKLSITDPIRILGFLFLGKPELVECQDAADANDSGRVDISDPIYILNHLYKDGPTLPPPFPGCGLDPTADGIDCATYARCRPPPPDTTAPVVKLTAPREAAAGEQVTLSADATDEVGVAIVEILLGGSIVASLTAPPFEAKVLLPTDRIGQSIPVAARARDAAGNQGEDAASILVLPLRDKTPPAVRLDAPAQANAGAAVTMTATASDDTGVTLVELFADGRAIASQSSPPFSASFVAPSDPARQKVDVEAVAHDAAGNTGRDAKTIRIVFETRDEPPRVSLSGPSQAAAGTTLRLVAEAADDRGVASVAFLVDGSPIGSDDNAPYEALFAVPEGIPPATAFVFTAIAQDTGGQETTARLTVTIAVAPDTRAPVIEAVNAPQQVAPGAAFAITARVTDDRGVSLVQVLTGAPDSETRLGEDSVEPYGFDLTAPSVPGPAEYTVRAEDFEGNDSTRGVAVEVVPDFIPQPPKVRLVVPGEAAAGTRIKLIATVEDAAGIESVTFLEGTRLIGARPAPPFSAEFAIAADAVPGTLLAFRARARNLLALEAEAEAIVTVTERRTSVVEGEVYASENGYPAGGAVIEVLGTDLTALSGGTGRYVLNIPEGSVRLRIRAAGRQTAYRSIDARGGAAVDAISVHLAQLGRAEQVSSLLGGSVASASGIAALEIDAGSLAQETEVSVTPLQGHSLPDLLPLGWSPLAAAFIGPAAVQLGSGARLRWRGAPDSGADALLLARYDAGAGAWVRSEGEAVRDGGDIVATVRGGGEFAVVLPDPGASLEAPAPGAPLPAAPAADAPENLAVQVLPSNPVIISSRDEINDVRVLVTGLGAAPSGTIVRVDAAESYRFLDGSGLALESFPHDIAIYRRGAGGPAGAGGADGAASFLLAPAEEFTPGVIEGGRIDLDVFAAASLAAPLVIGSEGGVLAASGARLSIAPGQFLFSTGMQLELLTAGELPLPLPAALRFLAAARLDAAGVSFPIDATFSVPAAGEPDGPVLLLDAREVGGRTRLVIAGEGAVSGGVATVQLRVRDGSSWILARPAASAGSVAGRVRRSAGGGGGPAAGALVTTDGDVLAFITGADGAYRLPLAAGTATVRALLEATGEAAVGTVSVESGLEAALDLALEAGVPRVLSIAPQAEASGVSLGTTVILSLSEPADEASFNAAAVPLAGPGGPVEADYILLPGGLSGVIQPRALLAPVSTYEVAVTSGLQSRSGAPFTPASSRFQTLDNSLPRRPEAGQISMTTPDGDGRVTIRGTQGTASPAAAITAVNETTGATATVVAGDDGTFQVRLTASRIDTIRLRIRDAAGNEIVVSPGIFDGGDGTAIVGPDGGIMRTPDGSEITFQPGAFEVPTDVRIERITEAEAPVQLPAATQERFGIGFAAGFKIDTGGKEVLKPLKVKVPLEQAFPPDTRFLWAKADEQGGETLLVALDDGSYVDGAIKTNSEPWRGLAGQLGTIMGMFLPRQKLTFLHGRVLKAPRLGVVAISVDAATLNTEKADVVAVATPLAPGVTVKSIEIFRRFDPSSLLLPDPTQFGEVGQAVNPDTLPGLYDLIASTSQPFLEVKDSLDTSFFEEVSSLIQYVLLGEKLQTYAATAVFSDDGGTQYRVHAEVSTRIAVFLDQFDTNRVTSSKHVFKTDRGFAKPARGAYVEVFNGAKRRYPCVALTSGSGEFVLPVEPGVAAFRVFDPLTGGGTTFPFIAPDLFFEFSEVGDVFVPEAQGDTRPPTVSVQVTGTFEPLESFTITVTSTDDTNLHIIRISVLGELLVDLLVTGISHVDTIDYTPLSAREYPIDVEVFDVAGNSVERQTTVRVRDLPQGLPAVQSVDDISIEDGSVGIPVDAPAYLTVTISGGSASAAALVSLDNVPGLDVFYEEPMSGLKVRAEGCVVSINSAANPQKAVLRIRPEQNLPINTDLVLSVNGQTRSFRTSGFDGFATVSGFQEIRGIAVRKQHAYVADFGDAVASLKVVSVEDPTQPFLAGSVPFRTARGVAIGITQERDLLVAVGGGQTDLPVLRVFDLSSPSSPVRLGNAVLFPLADQVIPTNVRVAGSLAYVCSIGAGVQVVDLPELVRIGGIPISQRKPLELDGQLAIVGGFRLPNPEAQPRLVGSPFDVALGLPGITLTGGGASPRLFVLADPGGGFLNLIPSPTLEAPFTLPQPVQRVQSSADYLVQKDLNGDGRAELQNIQLAAVSHGTSGDVSLVDLSNQSKPMLLSTVNVGSPVFDIEVEKGFIFTGDRLVFVLDPAKPSLSAPFQGMSAGGDVALQALPRLPGALQKFLALASTGDRKSLQVARISIPRSVSDRDWDIIRTTKYEPRINPDNLDYLNTGDPVNPFTGEIECAETDLIIAGRGFHFAFTRTYRSQIEYNGPLGQGWDHVYNDRLTKMPPGSPGAGDVLRHDGSGRTDGFHPTGNGFDSPRGTFGVLKQIASGFELEEPDGTRRSYEPTFHAPSERFRLAKIVDRHGNFMTFHYSLFDRLLKVVETMGREITFAHDSRGHITSITDFTGRTVTYTYDCDDNLAAVTGPKAPPDFPSGNTTTYLYSAGFKEVDLAGNPTETRRLNHNLLGILDAKGQTYITLTYSPSLTATDIDFDRVKVQTLGCGSVGGEYQYSYFGQGGFSPTVTRAETVNRSAHRTIRHYSSEGQLEKLEVMVSGLLLPTSWTYTPDGLIETETTPRGVKTTYTYRGGTNRLRQADLTGKLENGIGGGIRSWGFDPGPFGIPKKVADPLQNAVSYMVDLNNGDITQVDYPLGLTERFTYKSTGEVDTHTALDGTSTQYVYYTAPDGKTGYLRKVIVTPYLGAGQAVAAGQIPYSLETSFVVDLLGNATSITDSRNRTETRTYTALNQVATVTDPRGTRVFHYDANDNLKTALERDGRLFERHYDCLDRVTSVVEHNGKVARSRAFGSAYDPSENLRLITSPLQRSYEMAHDERALLLTVTTFGGPNQVQGLVQSNTYDADGNLATATDAEGKTTVYAYNGFNELESVTDPNGNRTEYEYDSRGLLTVERHRDPGGNLVKEVVRDHDALSRLMKEHEKVLDDAGGNLFPGQEQFVRYDYEPGNNHVQTVTDSLARVETMEHDGLGRIVFSRDAEGNERVWLFDGPDLSKMIEREKEPDGSFVSTTTTYKFDGFGRIMEVRRAPGTPDERMQTFDYDALDNLKLLTVAGGETIVPTYDGYNRLETITNGREKTVYKYDDDDRIERIEDGEGRGVDMVYDGRNRLFRTTYEDSSDETRTYNPDDTVRTLTDRAGNVFTYSYDDGNRQTGVAVATAAGFEPTSAASFVYDALDRVTVARDIPPGGLQRIVEHRFDSRGALLEETQAGKTVSSSFNLEDEPIGIAYPGPGAGGTGTSLTLDTDRLGRVRKVFRGATRLAEYGFSGPARRATAVFDNGTRSVRLFNKAREERERQFTGRAGAFLSGFQYGHNGSGRVTGESRLHDGGNGDAFAFTQEQWLEQAHLGVAAPLAANALAQPAQTAIDFAHDKSGNWTSRTANGSPETFVPNALNQYGTARGSTLTYDQNGNLTNDSRRQYLYDAYGRLRRVLDSTGDVEIVRFEYDALGRRVIETASGQTEEFIYDGDDIVIVFDGTGAVNREYVHSDVPDHPILLRLGGDQDLYYQVDGLGSVIALTDASGAVVERYEYDPFGAPTILAPDGATRTASAFGNRRLFKGQYFDPRTGLYHMGARDYDPAIGRFLQPDPSGMSDGTNLYEYAGNDPVDLYDPTGLYRQASADNMRAGHFIQIPVIGGISYEEGLGLAMAFAGSVGGAIRSVGGVFKSGARLAKGASSWERHVASRDRHIANARNQPTLKGKARELKKAGLGRDARKNMIRTGKVCFVAGTKVLTEHGPRNIENIRVGDRVLSRDDRTGEQAFKTVTATFITHPVTLHHIRYRCLKPEAEDGSEDPDAGAEGELACTGEHPFRCGGFWKAARDLEAGDRLALSDDTQAVLVARSVQDAAPGTCFTTHNLTVESFHTYFVAGGARSALSALWVHNNSKGPTATCAPVEFGPKYKTKNMREIFENLDKERKVPHLTPAEQDLTKVRFGKNAQGKTLLLEADGKTPLNTNKLRDGIFVMDDQGNLFIADRAHARGVLHHSSFLGGKPVAAAGEIRVVRGRVEYIDDFSGHYAPTPEYLDHALKELTDRGVDLRSTTINRLSLRYHKP